MPTNNHLYLALRYAVMLVGLTLLSLGILLSVRAHMGVSAWTVFHLGIARHIGWTQGQVSQAVGGALILLSLMLGIKPAPATILNMFLVGRIYDLLDAGNLITSPETFVGRVFLLLSSIWVVAIGTALYISVSLGAGPRDSLMLALTQRSKWRIGMVRNAIEMTVLIIGVILGGPLGVGTVVFALLIGPVLEFNLRLLRWVQTRWHLEKLLTVVDLKKPHAEQPGQARA